MSRRREPRLEANYEVKVWGLDRLGKPFVQHAHTLDITNSGARLIGVDCVSVGDMIGIQSGNLKARYKVVWVGRNNTPKAGQIGVYCLDSEKSIFTAPARVATEPALARLIRPDSGFQAVKGARPIQRDAALLRRKHPRYPCAGGIELRQQESGAPAWGNLSDVSLTGCYVETVSTFPVGSNLLFYLRTHDLEIRGRAVVKTSHHTVGMGIAFLHLGQDDQQQLEFLLGVLAGAQEMRPEEKRTFVPADSPIETVAPAAAKNAAAACDSISSHIASTIAHLTELEQWLAREKADPRLIAQFHDAMEHTRQTAWTVQHWVDLRSNGGDPFAVLPQLESERINMLTKLARHVLADIDSGGLGEFTEGITELYEASDQLHKRLVKMFADAPEDQGESPTFNARR